MIQIQDAANLPGIALEFFRKAQLGHLRFLHGLVQGELCRFQGGDGNGGLVRFGGKGGGGVGTDPSKNVMLRSKIFRRNCQ